MYFSEGSRSAPREIFEVIQNGKLIRVVDFKLIESFEKKSNRKKYSYDLGFQNQINHFLFNANKIDFKENFLDELETMDLTLSLFEKIST
jgi:Zn/Cd-binding protein ZinT